MPKKKIAVHPAAQHGADLYATLSEAAIYAASPTPDAARQLGARYARELAHTIDAEINTTGLRAPDGGRPQVLLNYTATSPAAVVAVRCGIDPGLLPTMARVIVTTLGVTLETNAWTAPGRSTTARVFDTLDSVIAATVTPLPVSGTRNRS